MFISISEARSLLSAIVKITVFFTLFMYLPFMSQGLDMTMIASIAAKVFVSVGIGTAIHEMAHKFMALPHDPNARITGNALVYAARVPLQTRGIISLAGPIGSMIASVGFWGLTHVASGFLLEIASFGFFINAVMATYNLIPLDPFDGKTVFTWSKLVWGLSFVLSFALTYYVYIKPDLF